MNRIFHQFRNAWTLPRWRWALVTALLSDALGFGVMLWPPALWLLDAITAAVLFALLGFRWPLLPALAIEVVPGLELFPAWTLIVLALAGAETRQPLSITAAAVMQDNPSIDRKPSRLTGSPAARRRKLDKKGEIITVERDPCLASANSGPT